MTRTCAVRAHVRTLRSRDESDIHRQLRNEVALMNLDRELPAAIEEAFARLSREDREMAERIRETW